MTAKPIPAWAIEAANNVVDHGGADRALIAALLVSTREAALREAYAIADFHGDMEVMAEIESLIDRSPS